MVILGLGEQGDFRGAYRFGISDLDYNEIDRLIEFNHPSQQRIGGRPVRQFVGIGEETMNFRGIMYPLDFRFNGHGLQSFEDMRKKAGSGVSYPLASNRGIYFGRWVILSISDTQTLFAPGGTPQKIEFEISVGHSGEDDEMPIIGAQF